MNSDEKACPYCGEIIKAVAIKCKHCQSDISTLQNASTSENQFANTKSDGSVLLDLNKEESSAEEKTKRSIFLSPLPGIIVLAAICAIFYFQMRPSCDSEQVKKTLFKILDQKVLELSKYGLNDTHIVKSLETVTRVSSKDDAKSCAANLILTFPKSITENLGKIASSKQDFDIFDPQFALKTSLKGTWNSSRNRIEVGIRYQYTGDAVMLGGGLETLALFGLKEVIGYVGENKSLIVQEDRSRENASTGGATQQTQSQQIQVFPIQPAALPEDQQEQILLAEQMNSLQLPNGKFGLLSTVDYTASFIPLTNISIRGAALLHIEHERLITWIGCCPNTGLRLLFKPSEGGISKILTELRSENCKQQDLQQSDRNELDKLRVGKGYTKLPQENLVWVDCREK